MLAAALAGCSSQPETSPRASASAAPTPMFASDDAALAAATDAYAAYLKMSDTIAHEGGTNPERLRPFMTKPAFENEKDDLKVWQDAKHHADGWSTFREMKVQSSSPLTVSVYLCLDISAVRILDEHGSDVTPPDRIGVLPLGLQLQADANHKLLIGDSEVWSGHNFC